MQKALPLLLGFLLLTGCSNLDFPGVYRIDIPQGNIVTRDMLSQLKPGMTPDQVRYVLGPPTLHDPFDKDVWYYVLDYRPGEGKPVKQQILVHFDSGKYDHYSGHVVADVKEKTSGRKDLELQKKAREQRRETEKEGAANVDLGDQSGSGAPGPGPEGGAEAPGPDGDGS